MLQSARVGRCEYLCNTHGRKMPFLCKGVFISTDILRGRHVTVTRRHPTDGSRNVSIQTFLKIMENLCGEYLTCLCQLKSVYVDADPHVRYMWIHWSRFVNTSPKKIREITNGSLVWQFHWGLSLLKLLKNRYRYQFKKDCFFRQECWKMNGLLKR